MKAIQKVFFILISSIFITEVKAQLWQMDVELTNGSTVSYIMSKVQDVVYDNHRTIINLRSRSTYMQKIYQNDAVVAGQSLKLCLGQTLNWASYYCGNAILSGALASVAFLDFALNKFAERAWSGRKDIYRKAYELYYEKGHPGYRSARDWYTILSPIMKRKDLTADQIHRLVDEEVTGHVWKFWEDETVVAEYITEAHDNFGFTFGGGLNEGIKAELSNEQRGNLFNGYLVSVFEAINDQIEQEMYEQCSKQFEQYAKELNKICMLTFTDRGLPLDDGTSRYGRCLVRFKELPSDMKDKELWQVKLTDQGYGSIQFRAFAMYDGGVKPNVEVIDEEGEVVLEIELQNLRAGYTRDTGENIIDLNDYGSPEQNTSDSYDITMTPTFQHVDFDMGGYSDGQWFSNTDPDEKEGIYFEDMVQDIVSAMQANKYVNISATGKMSRNDDGLQFSGTYNKETRTGSGTFRLQASENIDVMTDDQVESIFRNWDSYYQWMLDAYNRWGGYNVLKSGNMSHDIGGTFTLQDMGDYYLYRFSGIGSYTLNATAIQRAVNIRCIPQQTYSGPLSIEYTDVEVKGQATMEYQFTVKK
ncbi:MAG: hypothetical protein IJ767_03405 [Bacteroidaceae bacterium]|nr:hypothetical protein [Bacteroidaceae bacterium]